VRCRYGKVFQIGTVRYNWPMSAHASQAFSIAYCTDSEDLLSYGHKLVMCGFQADPFGPPTSYINGLKIRGHSTSYFLTFCTIYLLSLSVQFFKKEISCAHHLQRNPLRGMLIRWWVSCHHC